MEKINDFLNEQFRRIAKEKEKIIFEVLVAESPQEHEVINLKRTLSKIDFPGIACKKEVVAGVRFGVENLETLDLILGKVPSTLKIETRTFLVEDAKVKGHSWESYAYMLQYGFLDVASKFYCEIIHTEKDGDLKISLTKTLVDEVRSYCKERGEEIPKLFVNLKEKV